MDSLLIQLLDRSASMADGGWRYRPKPPEVVRWLANGGLEGYNPAGSAKAYGTMTAYNHFLQVMQMREDDCHYLFAQFASNVYIKHNGPLGTAPMLDLGWDAGGSGTNLWGSITALLENVDQLLRRLPKSEQPRNVTFVIQTDGEDGSPHEYARDEVAKRIAQGWDVIFLAAGNKAADAATRLGLKPQQIVQYKETNPGPAFELAANTIIEHLTIGEV